MDTTIAEDLEVRGRVVRPGDDDYDEVRQVFYGDHDLKPAAIVRVADADDVAAVLAYVRRTGVDLAVRSGGHSSSGKSTTEGLVLDVRDLRELEIDADAKTAWAGTGLTAGEFSTEAAKHGLAVPFGDAAGVGLGGLGIGGGIGFLARKHGMAIDHVIAADVVTADGELVRADADTNPDLFWALRGGGGNFGVVTRLQFSLVEVGQVVGGMLVIPATAETIAAWVDVAQNAPEELSIIANVFNCPPLPFVPEEWHEKPVIMGMACYAGDVEDGWRALEPLKAIAEPITDMLAESTYPELLEPNEPGFHPMAASRTGFADEITEADAGTIVDRIVTSDASMRAVQLRALGGQLARVPADETAYAHRTQKILVNVASFYEEPDQLAARQEWTAELAGQLHDGDAKYVGFLDAAEDVHDAYPGETWDRLVEVKKRYDPDNLFHSNANIPPA